MSLRNDADFYRTSKLDWVFIGLIIFFSIFWITKNRSQHSSHPGEGVIYQRDTLLEKVDLKKDNLLSILDGRMRLEVKGGRLRVLNSDCPQALCVNMGWIQHSGQTIVCVPNQVVIEIESAGSPILDAMVY